MTIGDYVLVALVALVCVQAWHGHRRTARALTEIQACLVDLQAVEPMTCAYVPPATAQAETRADVLPFSASPTTQTDGVPISMSPSPIVREAMADPVFRSEMRSAGRALLRKRLEEKAKAARAKA